MITQAQFIEHVWRRILAYPFPQVCKHLIVCNILSDMEEHLGAVIPDGLARAVVQCDDDTALMFDPVTPGYEEKT